MSTTVPNNQATGLSPPFGCGTSLVALGQIIMPTAVRRDSRLVSPSQDTAQVLSVELCTPKLNRLHQHLWFAGLPLPARPLHRQLLIGRSLALTERPDEHLVWHRHRLYVKPLPAFLLCHAFWEQHLCQDSVLHRKACGFLLSYSWLIAYKSDFDVAHRHSLLPDGIDWVAWTSFTQDFIRHTGLPSFGQVDLRYQYGELRQSRLDMAARYIALTELSFRAFVYGFMSTSTWYEAFFEQNFGWLLGAFVVFSVILSALQVGLATDALRGSQTYQNFSLVIAIATLSAVACGSLVVFTVWAVLFWYHLLSTIVFYREVASEHTMGLRKMP